MVNRSESISGMDVISGQQQHRTASENGKKRNQSNANNATIMETQADNQVTLGEISSSHNRKY